MFDSEVIKQEVIASSKSETGYVFVSTVDAYDGGLETMVFSCDAQGRVTDWGELSAERYDTEDDAATGHANIVSSWKA